MRESKDTVRTAYGLLNRKVLLEAQGRYETQALLQAVDELDRLVAAVTARDGLRDMLLRLHGMAHAVINGAELAVATNRETLPELAFDVIAELLDGVEALNRTIKVVQPLERLQVDD